MNTRNPVPTLLFAAALTGCAFSGGQVGTLPPPQRPDEAGTLTIYRDGSLIGIFGTMHVSLDQTDLYRLGMNQSYSMRLTPGHYFLNYSIGLNDCGGVVNVQPRQTLRLRLTPDCMMDPD
ncbi:hypothetical protein [Thiocystis violacea]|uniref:hypothetical protein n=1 Tax=Thiocystis violacea TaxID=13725 RepID=UPI0019084F21|nr:hypothetical protein [Thiocystis violacea]MBK1720662.1 hypothetical protein [Thiocystis violacea]